MLRRHGVDASVDRRGGPDRRYIVVIESLQSSDDATARDTITQAVKTMFPDGRIAPIPF